MKKLLFIFLMVFSLSFAFACGDKEEEKTPAEPDVPTVEEPTQPVEPTPEEPTQPVEPTPVVEYSVTFVVDGKEEVVKVKENEKAAKPVDPVKEGFEFAGWYTDEACTSAYDFEAQVTADLKLYAKFNEKVVKKYTVTFIVEGEVVYTEEVEEGKDATLPADPVIEGAVFACWDGNWENVTQNEEVVAIIDYNLYAVYFMVDGETYGDPAEVEHGKACPLPADPEKPGYKFVGWDKDLTSVKYDAIVNAIFEVEKYTIKYYSGANEIAACGPVEYTVEDTFSLEPYAVENYGFAGWFNNADLTGDMFNDIKAGTTGDLTLYAFNAEADVNGGAESWSTEIPSGFAAAKGIDAISNLPEIFEADFFKYLSDNDLLADSRVDATCQVKTWAEFSGVNPLHNGDPQRIWNDTSSAKAGSANGYVSIFLFDTITLNEDKTIKDVQGGFLGTEPYRTKYWGLLSSLVLMQYYKSTSSSKYTVIEANTPQARAFTGFTIDGYFYGTQGVSDSYFEKLRNVIPGVGFGYKLNGENIEKIEFDSCLLPTPVKDGYVFAGWYLDKECTKKVGSEKTNNLSKVYAKWEELK